MKENDFRLQSARILCGYPESPIFSDVAASVVNIHLHNFEAWSKYGSTLYLRNSTQNLVRLRLAQTLCQMDFESLYKLEESKIGEVIINSRDVMIDALKGFGYDSINRAAYSYRYFKKVEDIEKEISNISPLLVTIPNNMINYFSSPIKDFNWSVTLPTLNNKNWIDCSVYSVFKEHIEDGFILSSEECGQNGIVIELAIKNLPLQSKMSISMFQEMLSFDLTEVKKIFQVIYNEIYKS